ncbi:MAG: sigma-70 family RNA polymerase sigma factor [Verrucomicrobia bacterium]|nr:sigma-70 family RNA polymerase sigma factor [Verrucomicrobiota bacterium]
MAGPSDTHDSLLQKRTIFATTHWSVVLAAGAADSPHAAAALENLCQVYWYPLYAYVRRAGHPPHDSQDLTQEFFARLLGRNDLAQVRPEKGKFRSFLLASMKHFLANEWKKAKRLKRGGGQTFVPIDVTDCETRYGEEPADLVAPDKIFERRWALTLLERTLAQLRQEYAADGRTELFEVLKTFLIGGTDLPTYAEIASGLGLREDTVKMSVHRLRKRYRETLRQEVAHTVSSPAEIDEELRHLFDALL